jgi:outer membrane lipoprotein-sorting protein
MLLITSDSHAKRHIKAPEPKDPVQLIERYLNSFSSLKLQFIQLDDNANARSGFLYIAKPGKMKLLYETDSGLETFIMKNNLLLHRDPTIGSDNYLPANQAVLQFLSKKNFSFAHNAKIIQCIKGHNHILITFQLTGEESRTINISFGLNPVQFRSITLQEEDEMMMIEILKTEVNPKIPNTFFDFSY